MRQPVSIVIPCLDDQELLDLNLPTLLEELDTRAADDEVVIVDDTGEGMLEGWLAEHFPAVKVLTRARNGGFASALYSGLERARHPLAFCMNPDIRVRPGFLEPLVEALLDPIVAAAVPRVLWQGQQEIIESLARFDVRQGLLALRQAGLNGEVGRDCEAAGPVPYAMGGACLLRRHDFLAGGGFDNLYEPFYWEDVDFGWAAWRRGARVLYRPQAVVEHMHRGTIGKHLDSQVVRAIYDRNAWLFQWKFLDDPKRLRQHLAALYRLVIEAWLEEDRHELIALAMAFDRLEEALMRRRSLEPAVRSFGDILSTIDQTRRDPETHNGSGAASPPAKEAGE